VMKDLLIRNPSMAVTTVDISPRFSGIQSQTLKNYPVDYVVADFMELDPSYFARKDLAILNENLGDFPTLLDVQERSFRSLLLNRLNVECASFSHGIPSKPQTLTRSTSTWALSRRWKSFALPASLISSWESTVARRKPRSVTGGFSPSPLLISRREFPQRPR